MLLVVFCFSHSNKKVIFVRIQSKKQKGPKNEDLNVLVLPSSPSLLCFFLSVWMAAARGRQHLEEARQRQIEGIRARTEERKVQLKLTELETRIADLEHIQRELERKSTAPLLPFNSSFISSSFLFFLFILLSYYVFTSSLRGPTLHQIDSK